MHTKEMLRTHPRSGGAKESLAKCIDMLFACGQACTVCADACLSEADGKAALTRCIRLNLDCADICLATGRVASRLTETSGEVLGKQMEACAAICRACAEECEGHAERMEHCRVCAESCRECESACRDMLR